MGDHHDVAVVVAWSTMLHLVVSDDVAVVAPVAGAAVAVAGAGAAVEDAESDDAGGAVVAPRPPFGFGVGVGVDFDDVVVNCRKMDVVLVKQRVPDVVAPDVVLLLVVDAAVARNYGCYAPPDVHLVVVGGTRIVADGDADVVVPYNSACP